MVNLYPQIPEPEDKGGGSNPPVSGLEPPGEKESASRADLFRLTNISEALTFLEGEQAKYSRCKRRYTTVSNSIHNANMAVAAVSAGCAVGGVALFATGVGSVIGIAIEGVSIATCLASFGLGGIEKILHRKVQKHGALYTLASAKLSSSKLIISKALEDNKIDDFEFRRVQDDLDNYKRQKSEIQNKMRRQPVNVEDLKKTFLAEGKKLGVKETMERVQGLLSK
jgi:hypothetical protein